MDEWADICARDEITANKGKNRFGRAQIFKVGSNSIPVPLHSTCTIGIEVNS